MFQFGLYATFFVLIALCFLLIPLYLTPKLAFENESALNIAQAKQKLHDLEKHFSQGLISQQEFELSKDELLIILQNDLKQSTHDTLTLNETRGRWLMFPIGIAVPLIALTIYDMQGNTRAFDENVTVATKTMPQAPQASQINAMVENLAKRMQENPEDAKGWLMLARSYKVLKRYDESLTAMRKAHALMGDTPDVLLQLADILAIVGHGRLQGEASDLIEKALKLEPENEMGLWLYGLALAEREQYTQAISVWQKLQLHYADQDANYLEIQNLINQAKQAIGQAVVPPKALADSSKAFDQTNTADKGIELTVQLDAKFNTTVKPDDSVFIYAQALQGPKMPLAAVKKQVKDLPLNITLDDSMAMMPSRKLSSVDAVQIVARVSASGQAIAQSGEPIGKLETSTLVNHGVQNLIIDQVVP